jgi:hypothetical protein
MKNIIKSIALSMLAVAAIPMMTACSEDRDSNPTLETATEFHLNTPAIAKGESTYDLAKGSTLNLTCSQPNYGYTAPVIYEVQVSIDPNFKQTTESGGDVAFTTLKASYTSANMDVDGAELNNAVVKLYQNANNGEDPTGKNIPVYIRLRAHVDFTDNTYINSNVIELPRTQVSYVATTPTAMYISGKSIHHGNEAKQMGLIYGETDYFYCMMYADANTSVHFGDDNTASNGYANITTFQDNGNAGLTQAADGGIQFANKGWYIIVIQGKLDKDNNKVVYTFRTEAPKAYVIGAVAGGDWTDSNASWQLTVPETADGEWVSPAFAAAGELRAYMKIPGWDWYHTEFTIVNGKIYYRDVNLVDNWAKNKGAAYSVNCSAGQKLYINFDTDAMEVK